MAAVPGFDAGANATVHLSIKYDGPALASHQMDVRELAPALLSLAELLENANRVAYPDSPEVRVNVRGLFREGSFGVDLTAVQTLGQQLVAMFGGNTATAAANLFGILSGLGLIGGATAKGLIQLVKWLRGRKPIAVRFDNEHVVFEVRQDETVETLEVDLVAGKLYRSRSVRQALARLVRPLAREGIDTLECGDGEATTIVAEKSDVDYFEQAASESEVVSDTLAERVLLQLEAPSFREANKWRFSDGASTFHAEIADDEFLRAVDARSERFGKGDVLVVDLRRVRSVGESGLKIENIVDKVHEHREPLQAALFPLAVTGERRETN